MPIVILVVALATGAALMLVLLGFESARFNDRRQRLMALIKPGMTRSQIDRYLSDLGTELNYPGIDIDGKDNRDLGCGYVVFSEKDSPLNVFGFRKDLLEVRFDNEKATDVRVTRITQLGTPCAR